MTPVSALPSLDGYPFEVRFSPGTEARARVSADTAAAAYDYFSGLFSGAQPDIVLLVADHHDWPEDAPSYGMPFFSDQRGPRAGMLVMPDRTGEFWDSMAQELRDAPDHGYARLLQVYPDGRGGLELQPLIDLITLHELAHAFEVLGGLRLPTSWLGEMFANLALHTFVGDQQPDSLEQLETFSLVGAGSGALTSRCRFHQLDDWDVHYPGSEEPMSWSNYVWYQYHSQRAAASVFQADGVQALARFWRCFYREDRSHQGQVTAAALAPLLTAQVSETLGRAVAGWPGGSSR